MISQRLLLVISLIIVSITIMGCGSPYYYTEEDTDPKYNSDKPWYNDTIKAWSRFDLEPTEIGRMYAVEFGLEWDQKSFRELAEVVGITGHHAQRRNKLSRIKEVGLFHPYAPGDERKFFGKWILFSRSGHEIKFKVDKEGILNFKGVRPTSK